ncbi:MAG: M48 family metallopeptidase [Beutenbergiaceae bacterium]
MAVTTGREIEVRRSSRRRKTVSAFLEQGRLVVAIPARFTAAQEEQWVATMAQRVEATAQRRQVSDTDLMQRAQALAQAYLPQAIPTSLTWVPNQGKRWGSCTPAEGSIRISDRVQQMPDWVLDYVLMHELAHLVVRGHGPDFWELVNAYPHTERARGFLMGVAHAQAHGAAAPS